MINYKNAQDGFEPAPAPGGTPAPGLREGAGRGALPARPPAFASRLATAGTAPGALPLRHRCRGLAEPPRKAPTAASARRRSEGGAGGRGGRAPSPGQEGEPEFPQSTRF